MSDLVWQALIAGVVTIALAYMQMRTKNAVDSSDANRQAESKAALTKTEEVRSTLETSTTAQDKKLGEIHVLVNSNMERQLLVAAVALRRCAEQSRAANDPRADADEKAAIDAEQLLSEHRKKQALIDTGKVA
jgi:hypothetical protein